MSRTQSSESDERQVLALGQEWAAAEVSHDEAALKRILDDRVVVTYNDGRTVDKERFISDSRRWSMLSQTLADEIVRIHGDTAVVVGTTTVRTAADGKETSAALKYTVTYVKRQGR